METQKQIADVLDATRRLNPSLRFGQLVVNISYLAKGWTKSAPWDVEDEEFLKAAQDHLAHVQEKEWETVAA